DFGGSELQKLVDGKYSGKAPNMDLKVEKERQEKLLVTIQAGLIQSAEDIAEGGLAVTLAEKAIRAGHVGVDVTISGDATVELFSETQSRYVVSVKEENVEAFENSGLQAVKIGHVTEGNELVVHQENGEQVLNEKLTELSTLWKEQIEQSLKSN